MHSTAYAHQLKNGEWEVRLPIPGLGPTLVASVAAAYAPTRAIRFRPHAHFIRDMVDVLYIE